MGKTNFQYDETGNTYYYVFLTFLGLILLPFTYFMWPTFGATDDPIDPEKRKKYIRQVTRIRHNNSLLKIFQREAKLAF